MKFLFFILCLMTGRFACAQTLLDSTVTLVVRNPQMNPSLAVVKIGNAGDTITLQKLKESAYLSKRANEHVNFKVNGSGFIDGKSVKIYESGGYYDSTVYESASSKLIGWERYINGKKEVSVDYGNHVATVTYYMYDKVYYVEKIVSINEKLKTVRTEYHSDGTKSFVKDGIQNVDTTFHVNGSVNIVDNKANGEKKYFDFRGQLQRHEYRVIGRKNNKVYDTYDDRFSRGVIVRRVINSSDGRITTVIWFQNGEVSEKEVTEITSKGKVKEKIRTSFDKNGNQTGQKKSTETVEEETETSVPIINNGVVK